MNLQIALIVFVHTKSFFVMCLFLFIIYNKTSEKRYNTLCIQVTVHTIILMPKACLHLIKLVRQAHDMLVYVRTVMYYHGHI